MVGVHVVRMELSSVLPHPFAGLVSARLFFDKTDSRKSRAKFFIVFIFIFLRLILLRTSLPRNVLDAGVVVFVVALRQKSTFD